MLMKKCTGKNALKINRSLSSPICKYMLFFSTSSTSLHLFVLKCDIFVAINNLVSCY